MDDLLIHLSVTDGHAMMEIEIVGEDLPAMQVLDILRGLNEAMCRKIAACVNESVGADTTNMLSVDAQLELAEQVRMSHIQGQACVICQSLIPPADE